jgi:dATP/dGTP diphosphohydrolase, N-terminal
MRFGVKDDLEKPRPSLVPAGATMAVAAAFTHGAHKYAPFGWRTVPNGRERYLDAALRHIYAYMNGEVLDPESKLPPLAHAVASLMIVMELEREL